MIVKVLFLPLTTPILLGSGGIVLVALIILVFLAKGKLRPESKAGVLLFLLLIASPMVLAGGSVFVSSSGGPTRPSGPRLRIDPVPPWAHVVPWLTEDGCLKYAPNGYYCPNLVDDMDLIMAGALKLPVIFAIDLPNGTRTVLGAVYLSHDVDNLYIGVLLHGLYQSPSNNSTNQYATYFTLLLDTKNDGNLTYPESGSRYSTCGIVGYASCFNGPFTGGYYANLVWMNQTGWSQPQGGVNCGQSSGGYFTVASVSLHGDGDFAFFFWRTLRTTNHCPNGLQIQPGERWVMGFQMQLGYYGVEGSYARDWMSSWPAPPAFNLTTYNSSWWPKLVIDTRS